MNMESWQAGNSQYLSASLAWVRLRLEQLAKGAMETAVAEPEKEAVESKAGTPLQPPLLHRLFRSQNANGVGDAVAGDEPRLLEDFSLRLEQRIAQAAVERLACAAAMQPPPALQLLSEQLGLSPCEQDLLLLCVAIELDTQVPTLCARAQGDASRQYPTFALALALCEQPSWDLLSPDRPLRYWRLVEINQPGATPLTASALRADERIVNYIKGLNMLDDRLATLLWPAPAGESDLLSPSQQAVVDAILWQWRRPSTGGLPVAQLLGSDADSKQLIAQATATALRRQLYRLNPEALLGQAIELEAVTRLWQRESQLLPLALYVDLQSGEGAPAEANASLTRFLARATVANSVVLVGVRDALPRLPMPTFAVDVERPTVTEQRQAWSDVFEQLAEMMNGAAHNQDFQALGERLASQFSLNLPAIYDVAAGAWANPTNHSPDAPASPLDPAPFAAHLWDACRALTRPRLDTLAQRLDAKATWDDLVIPDEPLRLLRQIAAQVRHRHHVYEGWGFAQKMNRGLGISALFSGESGTGKTMAAEVIANDLRLNLYRIDLSAVVSKYIGETEKNLRRLFDAAEEGGAILFFDEADALFGKRSEVKDSHDRYANIEINYLLQRMEAYRGLAILATNMKSALDSAFMRRLRFIVQFTFPGVAERKQIWQKSFPPQTPKADLDYDRLARLTLSGGNIHSIALNAAFLAAQSGEPVTMPIVLAAARTEFRKLDKPVNEADFRWPVDNKK
jgi:hypothetical protein